MNQFTRRMGLLTTVVLLILLVVGVGVFVYIPWLADLVRDTFPHRVPTLIFMYVGGAAGIWLLVEFLRIMLSVKAGTPFIWRNVASFKHIAVCCALASAAVGFILCFSPSVTLAICLGILLFGMLCAIVLASVFAQAVKYKLENDLTV